MLQTIELKTKIPIRIEPGFLLVTGYIGWGYGDTPLRQAGAALVAAFSVLFHELGHALLARRFGCAPAITLHGTGGQTERSATLPFWKDLATIAAGPLSSLLLGALSFALLFFWGVAELPLRAVIAFPAAAALRMNLAWGALNSLPLLPLDGGKFALAVLARRWGLRALRWMHGWSLVGCGGLALWFALRGGIFGAVVTGALAFSHLNAFRALGKSGRPS